MLSFPDFKAKKVIVVFAKYGEKFSFKNDNLIVEDSTKKVILQDSCHRIFSLWIVGNCTITTGLLERSKKFAFSILMLNYSFRLLGIWNSQVEGNYLLRKKQYDFSNIDLARFLVHNKIQNQSLLLKSIRKKDEHIKDAIHLLQTYKDSIWDSKNIQHLMGIEGIASKVYFKNYFSELPYNGRKPRVKCDPINVILDIGYTKLFYVVENMLNLYGFDIYKGILHQNFYKRKSLVCDLQEPFRCIVEKMIKNAYNLKQFKEEDFEHKDYKYFLSFDKNKYYTDWLLRGILEHNNDIFLYIRDYYRAFIREKDIKDYPEFFISDLHTKEPL